MTLHDVVSHLIAEATGRSVDQHVVDPVPAAAHLPHTAQRFRHIRGELLLAVDRMRTMLIDGDDLRTPGDQTVNHAHTEIGGLIHSYRVARSDLDALITDEDRQRHAATQPARPVQRRYVKPGDTVLVVLPHTHTCRKRHLAGRRTRVRVGTHHATIALHSSSGTMVLAHHDAGIYRDPVSERLYFLASQGHQP